MQKDKKKLTQKRHVVNPTIDWKMAIDNVLPWIKKEIEKNGGEKKSIIADMPTLLNRMKVSPEIKKRANISSFKFSFQNNIIGKGYNIKVLKGGLIEITLDPSYEPLPQFSIEGDVKHHYTSISDHLDEIEKEENIRKMRGQFRGNTISVYKGEIDGIISSIKEGIDGSEDGIFAMEMEDIRRIFGRKFDVYTNISICNNIKIAMENYGIVTVLKGWKNHVWNGEYIGFRYKRDDEKFIWEKHGFSSRAKYEEYREWNRNCNNIRKKLDENKNSPDSVFSDKEFIKKIIACPVLENEQKEDV